MFMPVHVLRSRDNDKMFLVVHHAGGHVELGPIDRAFKFNYESLARHYLEMHPEMNLELCVLEYIVLPVEEG